VAANGGFLQKALGLALRVFVFLGALSGFVAVAAGAFGAHALQSRLSAEMLDVWKTAAHYQLVHSVLLVVVGVMLGARVSKLLSSAGWLLVAGVFLFSGSLYALVLSGVRTLGAVTPFGGLCFLGAWLLLAFSAFRARAS